MSVSGRPAKNHRDHFGSVPCRPGCATGFTLFELLVVLLLVAVLAALAAPSFRQSLVNSRILDARSGLSHALQLARSTALARQLPSGVCSSAAGQYCDGGADWAVGWIVYVDFDANGQFGGGDEILDTHARIPSLAISVDTGESQLQFAPSGVMAARGERAVQFCDIQSQRVAGRTLRVSTLGSVSMVDQASC